MHLCTDSSWRNRGVASQLVRALSERHRDRQRIELACRRDFPANGVWGRLGFRPAGERTGRSAAEHPLTIWVFDHGHPTLFTEIEGDRDVAALDHNVLQDLVTDRIQGEASRHLEDAWLTEVVELCITNEEWKEIDRCEDRALRERMLRRASAFRTLPSSSEARVDVMRVAVPSAGGSDHQQLAQAAAGQAAYFVTRDEALLNAEEKVEKSLRIRVTRPEELILRLDQLRSRGRYEPEALEGTAIVAGSVADLERGQYEAAFTNNGAGERAGQLKQILRPLLADPARNDLHVYRDLDGRLLATLAHAAEARTLEVKLIRVAAPGRLGNTLGRRLAFLARRTAAEKGLPRVVISDPAPSDAVQAILQDEEYSPSGDDERWTCEVARGLVHVSALRNERTGLEPSGVAAEESRCWPVKVLGGGLPTFMVSIAPSWAEDLFELTWPLEGCSAGPRSSASAESMSTIEVRRPMEESQARPASCGT